MQLKLKPLFGAGFILSTLLVANGCSLFSRKKDLPIPLGSVETDRTIELASSAKLALLLKLKRNTQCDNLRKKVTPTFRGSSGRSLSYQYLCDALKDYLVIQTSNYYPKGKYRISVKGDLSAFSGKPFASALYRQPDFNSSGDQVATGSLKLEANQQIQGTVNAANGDKSDWLQIDGDGTRTSITFLGESSNSHISVGLYRQSETGVPVRVKTLYPAKAEWVTLKSTPYFVKVLGHNYFGELGYTLVRSDKKATHALRLSVIDYLPISANQSLYLLKKIDGLKEQMDVSISGIRSDGKRISLGVCRITSFTETQASCEMDNSHSFKMLEYFASAAVEG